MTRVEEDGLRFDGDEEQADLLTVTLGRAGVRLRTFTVETATLEDLFFELTERAKQDVGAASAGCCVTLVTDVDPHLAWIHRALDANLIVGDADGCVAIRPPVPKAPRLGPSGREAVRGALGLPRRARIALIVGGAWGVGSLEEAARATLAAGLHPIVACGQNEPLRLGLSADPSLCQATILGFASSLPSLMAASDVLVQSAGGMTCLEGFAACLPVVMFDPLPGHGEQNARRLADDGLVARVYEPDGLTVLLSSARFWGTLAPRQVARALALFPRPPAAAVIEQATAVTRGAIATSRTRRQSRRPVARRIAAPRPHRVLVVVVALLGFGLADAPALARDRIPEPVPACAVAPSCF